MWAWLGDNGHPQRYEQATSDLLEAFYLQDGDAARARIDIGGVTYVTFECRDSSALDLAAVLRWRVLRPGEWDEGATDPILMCDLGEDGESVVRLPCHSDAISCTFNRSTVEQAFASSPKCPTCGQPYPLPGPQPSGVMRCRASGAYDCDGHPGCGVIEAPPGSNQAHASPGTSGPQHPRPGTAYSGTRRAAILPNDATGREALALLRAAFAQGKAFATQPMGGETRHGWPDATYLDRLRSECATAAVVPP
ncbi:hypothetical protein EMIHUDRAFT_195235 [Emiliania huxleyi CCMP1516]|uniref:RING-type E3 ubiquitin transferase n=2 Tax=Emiliania huxleyi TaxID=2903 RepID=A0A0D3JH54_EMIH1|nr:hypothetical protein EMIHUDRAFT_195235 [Emiliania huxleyi CCMP1516]EOD22839.1 hypothetical protein EMIHUDRAFT_195235 [Emiliania huxleyi CCMP1516]|eukprot:XP_005775268.1 hypothetical protein EMIHUDRAFT_195235 [Emiliania huxleyi CCMP1516]